MPRGYDAWSTDATTLGSGTQGILGQIGGGLSSFLQAGNPANVALPYLQDMNAIYSGQMQQQPFGNLRTLGDLFAGGLGAGAEGVQAAGSLERLLSQYSGEPVRSLLDQYLAQGVRAGTAIPSQLSPGTMGGFAAQSVDLTPPPNPTNVPGLRYDPMSGAFVDAQGNQWY